MILTIVVDGFGKNVPEPPFSYYCYGIVDCLSVDFILSYLTDIGLHRLHSAVRVDKISPATMSAAGLDSEIPAVSDNHTQGAKTQQTKGSRR